MATYSTMREFSDFDIRVIRKGDALLVFASTSPVGNCVAIIMLKRVSLATRRLAPDSPSQRKRICLGANVPALRVGPNPRPAAHKPHPIHSKQAGDKKSDIPICRAVIKPELTQTATTRAEIAWATKRQQKLSMTAAMSTRKSPTKMIIKYTASMECRTTISNAKEIKEVEFSKTRKKQESSDCKEREEDGSDETPQSRLVARTVRFGGTGTFASRLRRKIGAMIMLALRGLLVTGAMVVQVHSAGAGGLNGDGRHKYLKCG
ncbi:hypothetical protein BV22DRAFT_1122431 [Leucogyrophana mollusca]|uniref:Uncharacterized protein n=1 Tax=Leucogyrophana mollusca TaxID=85980 RepID=A0ACB8B7X8_9AGAM|nr:hypothetical protein BV22DRAFT_1122431 [Leucogyrophana mollusca]